VRRRSTAAAIAAATSPDELDDALREALNLIKNDAQSFVAPVVPVSQTNRTESGDRLYVALFARARASRTGRATSRSTRWTATTARSATPARPRARSAAVPRPWRTVPSSAPRNRSGTAPPAAVGNLGDSGGIGAVLQQSNVANRHIYTYLPTTTGNLGGVALTAAAQAFSKTNAAITPGMLGLTGVDNTTAARDLLIDYVYGFDSYDRNNNGNITEKRSWILGDIIHSVPLIVNYDTTGTNALIIVGSNDGMLHAFDDATGAEQWAFIPPDVLPNLHNLRPGDSATHPFFVDSSAKMKIVTSGSQKVLVFGSGAAAGRTTGSTSPRRRADPAVADQQLDVGLLGARAELVGAVAAALRELPLAGRRRRVRRWLRSLLRHPERDRGEQQRRHGPHDLHGRPGDRSEADHPGAAEWHDLRGPQRPADLRRQRRRHLRPRLHRRHGRQPVAHRRPLQRHAALPHAQQPKIYYQPDAVINNGSVMVHFGTGDRSSPMYVPTNPDRFYAVRDTGTDDVTESQLVNVTSNVTQPGSAAFNTLLAQINDASHFGWYIVLGSNGEKVLAPPTVFFNVDFATFTPWNAVCQAGGSAKI
jgi:hypothetical protein